MKLQVICLALALMTWGQTTTTLFADITVSRLFSDHMVLQQKTIVRIWGTAEPEEKVVIRFQDQEVQATANARGEWVAPLKTPAAGGPFQIEIAAAKGEPKIILEDVLIGEVWICSGQSNMEWPVSKANFPEREIDASKDFTNIRLLKVARHSTVEPTKELVKAKGWDVCNPDSVRDFSAVAYFFGRRLNVELGVPIGLIDASWGGTRCEAWMSLDALNAEPRFKPMMDQWVNSDTPASQNRPGNLFNGMISPLKGLEFQGALWYQGESNVGRGDQYRYLFPALIVDWRQQLAQGREFPFYFVQLAPFRYAQRNESDLAEVWDAQLHTYRFVPKTGMAVTTDITDIADIHPKNKQDVGARLALWALGDCYRNAEKKLSGTEVLVSSGPLYRSKEIVGNRIRLNFDFVANGLVSKDADTLVGFSICGADGKFQPAEARIEENQVVVWSESVPEPTEVRFAWSDTAQPNLFNSAGLPASPFRTDRFSLRSESVHF